MTTDQKQEIAAALERIDEYDEVLDEGALKTLRASYLSGELDDAQLESELHKATLKAARVAKMLASRPSANMNFYRGGDGGAMNQDSLTASFLIANGQEEVALAAYGDTTCQRARDAGLRSHDDHVRAAMRLAHQDVPADLNERVNAAASTVTYGEMLTRGAQAVLLAGARNYPDDYKRISRKMSVPDFRTHQAVRAYLGNGTFNELPDSGEIGHAAPGAEGYPIKASTFARMIEFGRQTVVNDQVGMLLEHIHELGRDYARTEADLFWSVILDEGGTFFKNANGNYNADSELGVEGLTTAIQKLRAMTTEDGRPIDVTPGFLVVPPALETTARQLLNSSELRYGLAEGDSTPVGNPFRDSMGLVVSPRLSASNGGSDSSWYVVSTPQSIPAFLRCYVGGRDVATVEQTDADFNTLGVRVRAWFDFGAALGDPRGAIKMNATG